MNLKLRKRWVEITTPLLTNSGTSDGRFLLKSPSYSFSSIKCGLISPYVVELQRL